MRFHGIMASIFLLEAILAASYAYHGYPTSWWMPSAFFIAAWLTFARRD